MGRGFIENLIRTAYAVDYMERKAAYDAERYERNQAALRRLDEEMRKLAEVGRRARVLRDIHKSCLASLSWHDALSRPPVPPPTPRHDHEAAAQADLVRRGPNLWHRLVGSAAAIRADLERKVVLARQLDEYENQRAAEDYAFDQAVRRWANGESEAMLDALKIFNPVKGVAGLGVEIKARVPHPSVIECVLQVYPGEIIPNFGLPLVPLDELRSQPFTGTSSVSEYQEYVCGCILRLGRELHGLLPVEAALVHAVWQRIDPATGHSVSQVIASVFMPIVKMQSLKYDSLQPSAAIRTTLEGRIALDQWMAFSPVEPLVAQDFVSATPPSAALRRTR